MRRMLWMTPSDKCLSRSWRGCHWLDYPWRWIYMPVSVCVYIMCGCVHVYTPACKLGCVHACLYASVSATWVCYTCVYWCVCVHSVCTCVACVHALSPSCRMSYCDPIYFLSESANTTNLYMYWLMYKLILNNILPYVCLLPVCGSCGSYAVWVLCLCMHIRVCMSVCLFHGCSYVYVHSVCACVAICTCIVINLVLQCIAQCVYCGCVVHVCIVLCILHWPSVAMHSPPPLHTHFIPLCHMLPH